MDCDALVPPGRALAAHDQLLVAGADDAFLREPCEPVREDLERDRAGAPGSDAGPAFHQTPERIVVLSGVVVRFRHAVLVEPRVAADEARHWAPVTGLGVDPVALGVVALLDELGAGLAHLAAQDHALLVLGHVVKGLLVGVREPHQIESRSSLYQCHRLPPRTDSRPARLHGA